MKNTSEERWKDILGYEGVYLISDHGRVKVLSTGYIRKYHITPKGYQRLQLSKDGKPKSFFIHRLVANAFLDKKEDQPQVNHIDCDKTNNHYLNLEWVSNSGNQLHAYKNGLQYIKYKVYCLELGLTTMGCGEMVRQLNLLGYDNARETSILSCIIGRTTHHLGLRFTGEILQKNT